MQLADFVNVPMLLEPFNWFVVALILMGAAFVLCLIFAPGGIGGLTQAI